MGQVVVVYGPEGCGKTKNVQALMKELGCSQCFDNGTLLSDLISAENSAFVLVGNVLVLTNHNYDVVVSEANKTKKSGPDFEVISFYDILPRLAKHNKFDDEKVIDFFQSIADGNQKPETGLITFLHHKDLHKLNRLCSLAMIGLEVEKGRELCSQDVAPDCYCEEAESEEQRIKRGRVLEERIHGINRLDALGLLSESEYRQRISDAYYNLP